MTISELNSINEIDFFLSYIKELKSSKVFFNSKSIILRIISKINDKIKPLDLDGLKRKLILKGRNIIKILKEMRYIERFNSHTWKIVRSLTNCSDLIVFHLSEKKRLILSRLNDGILTREELSKALGVSTQAIWEYIKQINLLVPSLIRINKIENKNNYSLNHDLIKKYEKYIKIF